MLSGSILPQSAKDRAVKMTIIEVAREFHSVLISNVPLFYGRPIMMPRDALSILSMSSMIAVSSLL